ncbi:MAG: response regulator [Proteobacteria bacterium]|nr:response regulator [Pseudomonadota bacterium]
MEKPFRKHTADRILIVDDEVATCEVLGQRLSKEGYSCVLAHNGKEALHHFYKENISLMIADIKMPEMDGLELLKKVKTLGPPMMVIMMTGYAEIDTVVKALHLGAYDFILKPFDLDLVVFSVKKALEKKRLEEVVAEHDQQLEELVEERTADLRRAYRMLKKAHLDSVKILVEAIDAMSSLRPYRREMSREDALVEMEKGKGKQFDPKILEIFLNLN